MRDPHVVALRYRLETHESVTFDNPQLVECETSAFRLRLENGVATLALKEHFTSLESARRIADDFLRAWELDAALGIGRREIKFTFQDAHIVDRNPPPPGSAPVTELNAQGMTALAGSITVHVTRRTYPNPPELFKVSPDVETLWQRFEGYLNGREPLPAMAYFCLTLIEGNANGCRGRAAKLYRISKHVLDELGKLTSRHGDAKTARKVQKDRAFKPLTVSEKGWIEAAVRVIIRRVGEINSDPTLPEISMDDLPKL
jgi:hypothetical protein